jgi:hypothetical protein
MALQAASNVSRDIRLLLGEHSIITLGRRNTWRDATEGDAYLMFDRLEAAAERYRRAVAMSESRDVESMYSQAIRVAERMFGRRGVARIEWTFGVWSARTDRSG